MNLLSKIWMVDLQINTVKYDVDWEIVNSSISIFHPFANICLYLVKLKTIQFIGIRICLVGLMMNNHLVLLEYSVNSNSNLNFKFVGKIKCIAVT